MQSAQVGDLTNTLAETLDAVDVGILRLDADLRIRFANPAFIAIWRLSPVLMAGRPYLGEMLAAAGESVWPDVPADEREEYFRWREIAIRAGAIPPARIQLPDGRQIHFRCDVCDDGGRLLTYLDITEHVRAVTLDAAQFGNAELRFQARTMEQQAARLAELVEVTHEHAQQAESARVRLMAEIAERQALEARLRVLATTDGLTGASNRSAFLADAQHEVERVCRSGQDLAILMIDVDHFKIINDRHGHAGGDAALQHLVDCLRASIRSADLLGRVGGEEFALALPDTAAEDAISVAERLRGRVEESPARYGDRQIPMTVSIGLAMRRPGDAAVSAIIARADNALYRAKHAGRNRVMVDELTPSALAAAVRPAGRKIDASVEGGRLVSY